MGPHFDSILHGTGASLFLLVPTVVGVFTAWFGYRKVFVVEQWRTTRLKAALEGAAPEARADILRALASVEREHPADRVFMAPRQEPPEAAVQTAGQAGMREGPGLPSTSGP